MAIINNIGDRGGATPHVTELPLYPNVEEIDQQFFGGTTTLGNANRGNSCSLIPTLTASTQLLAPRRMRDTKEWAQSDPSIQPPDVLDAGTSYQQLLNEMISSIPDNINFDAYLVHDLNGDGNSSQVITREDIINPVDASDVQQTQSQGQVVWYSRMNDMIKPCFNITPVDPLHYLPIKPTVQNGELFQVCK